MRGKRFARSVLYVVIGLAIVLAAQLSVLALSPGQQTTSDWRGEYYANLSLVGDPVVVRNDRASNGTPWLDFDWGSGAPAPGVPADQFSVRWTKWVSFEGGTYRFWATVDDGIRVFVDGALVIDAWQDGGQRQVAAERRLAGGQHAMRVEYYERAGVAVARLRWEQINSTAPDNNAWRGEYYNNRDLSGNPVLVRNDASPGGTLGLDLNWGNGAPAPGLPADYFSVRWTRTVNFDQGAYRFRASADDGIRLYVDGVLLIDEWRDGPQREVTAERWLAAGAHTLRVEYYEHGGLAAARLRWEKATPAAPDDPAWKGEYWTNLNLAGKPALVRNDAGPNGTLGIAFDWGQGSPGQAIPSDGFGARWTRKVNLDAGTYRFHALVDDGMRLRLNDRLILDAWSDHNLARLATDYTLTKGTYTIQVDYYERIGNARIQVWWEKVAVPSYGDWKGEYWPNSELSGVPDLVRNDRSPDGGLGLAFNWGAEAPSPDLPVDRFSARWTRQAYFEEGTYRFYVISDDGVRLWVDGQRLIDKWQDQAPSEHSKEIVLTRGTHALKVEYYDRVGDAQMRVWWQKVVSPSLAEWKGEYWANRDLSGSPALVHVDKGANGSGIDVNWGSRAPAKGLPQDDFSARWTRQETFRSGRYRLYAWADDGIRVYVDGKLVVNEWHSAWNQVYSVDLALNGAHQLVVEYYEQSGDAQVRFWWTRTGSL